MSPLSQKTNWQYWLALAALASLLLPTLLEAALPVKSIEKWGTPRIERFPARVTRIGDPVTQIAVMPRGEIAFLSESQFTVFDGTQWSSFEELNRPTQIVTANGDQTLVGHVGGMKRLHLNDFGGYDFESLAGAKKYSESPLSLRSITSARGHIFGSHGTYLTVIDPDGAEKVHHLESWVSTVFSIGEDIYATGGTTALINRWNWEEEKLVNCQQPLDDTEYIWFTAVKPRKQGGVWLLNQDNRIIGYDGEKTWFWPGNDTVAEKNSIVQDFVEIEPNQLAIATNNEGTLLFEPDGTLKRQISKQHGLDDVSVLGIGTDQQDGLWMSTKRSVSRIQLNSNILVYDERQGLNESVKAIAVFNDHIYLATPSGLYVNNPDARTPEESFLLKHRISGIADMLPHRGKLFVAASNLVMIDQNDQTTILAQDGATNFWQPSSNEDLILAGNYKGVIAIRFQDGKWSAPQQLPGPEREVFGLAEDDDGSLLASLGGQEFGVVTLEGDSGKFEVRPIPANMNGAWSMVITIEGNIYLNSAPHCMRWDPQTDAFVPTEDMIYYVGELPFGFEQVIGTSDKDAWVCINARQGKTVPRPSREVIAQISQINDGLETRAETIIYDKQGHAWIGGDFGLVLARRPLSITSREPARPSIHHLLSMKEGKTLPIVGGPDGILHLDTSQNSLRIEAEFNEYLGSHQNQLQIFIEGLDSVWPEFNSVPFREVTNLPPGNYTLIINARNVHSQNSSYALAIKVATPAHLKPIAYVFYAIAAILLISGIVYYYNRHQIKRSRHLQKLVSERTHELEQQAIRLEQQNEELEEKTEELTATTETLTTTLNELHEMQDRLVDTARTAGKAEIAINVLHNVGNVLNSLNVSINVLSQRTEESNVSKLRRLANLIDTHQENISEFLSTDPKGKKVPTYLIHLADTLESEVKGFTHELGLMSEDIDHVKSIIAAQQTHAKSDSLVEEIQIQDLCQTALNIVINDHSKAKVELINEVPTEIVVENDKHRLLDIILNLISNAFDAIEEQKPELGVLTLRAQTLPGEDRIEFSVKDNGSGISPENLEKLFQHGFTTKPNGHGFGLHSCANAVKSLGGELTLNSPGKSKGATATLVLPVSFPRKT